MSESNSAKIGFAGQYEAIEQRNEASLLGIWGFLATEVLFFGGFFTAYTIYRRTYPEGFAFASHELNETLGTLNTAILLTSSWTIALAVQEAERGDSSKALRRIAATFALGFAFMGVKAFEYLEDFSKGFFPSAPNLSRVPGASIFAWLYYAMTALHGLHVLIGLGLMLWLLRKVFREKRASGTEGCMDGRVDAIPVEVCALYWHFVDLIWIFLYPLLYLVKSHAR